MIVNVVVVCIANIIITNPPHPSALRVAEVWWDYLFCSSIAAEDPIIVASKGRRSPRFPRCAFGLLPLIQDATRKFAAVVRVNFAVHGGLYRKIVVGCMGGGGELVEKS